MLVDLRSVAAAKFRPAVRVVTEPFSQGRAGRDILDPLIGRGIGFLDPVRPQAVDQYPGSVIGGGGFIGATEPRTSLRKLNCAASATPLPALF